MSKLQFLELERQDAVALVRLNRPEVLNAINQAMWSELLNAFREVKEDADVKVCVITGAGRGFCSGADLKETAWHGESLEDSRKRINAHHQELARVMLSVPAPIIAAITMSRPVRRPPSVRRVIRSRRPFTAST